MSLAIEEITIGDAERLTAWTERRSALAEELAAAQQTLRERQDALVEGTVSAADVDSASLRVATLDGALRELGERIAAAEGRERVREAAEARTTLVERMAEQARRAALATAEFEEARTEGAKALQTAIRRMHVAHAARLEARAQFLTLGNTAAPAFRNVPPEGRAGVEAEQREEALDLVREVAELVDLSGIAPNWQYLNPGPQHGIPATALDQLRIPTRTAELGEIGDALDVAAGFRPASKR